MGGYGSTRWNWHNKRLTVEDCYKMSISNLKPYLHPNYYGQSTWTSGSGWQTGALGWQTSGDPLKSIRLIYTITDWASGEKVDCDYPVPLTWTLTPWGARRYWFSCPGCGRRSGALYLAPGRRFFRCRLYCDLTYTSCQESHQYDGLFNSLAWGMQDTHPGITGNDLKAILDGKSPQVNIPLLGAPIG